MKKLIKWMLIIGVICCLLGIGIVTAGVMMGGQDGLKHTGLKLPSYSALYPRPPQETVAVAEGIEESSAEAAPMETGGTAPGETDGAVPAEPGGGAAPAEPDGSMSGEPGVTVPAEPEKTAPESPGVAAPGNSGEMSGSSEAAPAQSEAGTGQNRAVPGSGGASPGRHDRHHRSESLPLTAKQSYQGVRNLDLEICAGTVELCETKEAEADEIIIYHYGGGNLYEVKQDGRDLEIELPDHTRPSNGMETLVIGVPVGYSLGELDIEMKAGSFYADMLYADELSMELTAGEISIQDGSVRYLEAEVSAGDIECLAAVSENVGIAVSAGSVDIRMAGEKQDYDYQLQCAGGSIVLEGDEPEEYSALNGSKRIDNHTGRKVELRSNMGTIIVDYQKPTV